MEKAWPSPHTIARLVTNFRQGHKMPLDRRFSALNHPAKIATLALAT